MKAAGFDPAVPTVWLLEGLLMYLSASDTQDLMQDVQPGERGTRKGGDSAPGGFGYGNHGASERCTTITNQYS